MTGLIRKATITTVLGLLVARGRVGGVPSAGTRLCRLAEAWRLSARSPPGTASYRRSATPSQLLRACGGWWRFNVTFTPVTVDFTPATISTSRQSAAAGTTRGLYQPPGVQEHRWLRQRDLQHHPGLEQPSGNEFPSSPSTTFQCADISCSSQHLAFAEVITIDMDNLVGVGAG